MKENVSYDLYAESFALSPASRVPEDCFLAAMRKAESYLSSVTFGRIAYAEPTEDVLACLCELAELFYRESMRGGRVSENNDGYAVTYDEDDFYRSALEIVKLYLCGTGLLYQGAMTC